MAILLGVGESKAIPNEGGEAGGEAANMIPLKHTKSAIQKNGGMSVFCSGYSYLS